MFDWSKWSAKFSTLRTSFFRRVGTVRPTASETIPQIPTNFNFSMQWIHKSSLPVKFEIGRLISYLDEFPTECT